MELGLGAERCITRVLIGKDGIPYEVTVEDCHAAFHQATHDAVMAWRWEPVTYRGKPTLAQTTVSVPFQPPAGQVGAE